MLEERLPADSNTSYPMCIAGERACLPEDCGGTTGFYDLLDGVDRGLTFLQRRRGKAQKG